MQLRAAGGEKILQQVRQDLPRDEEIAAALRDVDIPHRIPLDPAAHERAEKIPVRERVARKIHRADGRDGPLVPREPALVQILRHIAADLALGHGRAAEEGKVLPPQQLRGEHLLALGQKRRRGGDIAASRRSDALIDPGQQDLVFLRLRHPGDLFSFVHAPPPVLQRYCSSPAKKKQWRLVFERRGIILGICSAANLKDCSRADTLQQICNCHSAFSFASPKENAGKRKRA